MQKFLGIVVLGLLWCNFVSAQNFKFENEIILNVPDKFIYMEGDNDSEITSVLRDLFGDDAFSYIIGPKDWDFCKPSKKPVKVLINISKEIFAITNFIMKLISLLWNS